MSNTIERPVRFSDTLRKPFARPPALTGDVVTDALVYASMGWKVFPVKRDKKPLIMGLSDITHERTADVPRVLPRAIENGLRDR
jgi:hypothetical protein